MRRTGTHLHYCSNRKQGCQSSWECRNTHLESNYDGWPDPVCGVNPDDGVECEDCATSRCSECGCVRNIEPCDQDCPKATEI